MTRDRNYSLKRLIALRALGRRCESCRPDSSNPIHRDSFPDSLFYLLAISDEKGALGVAHVSSKIL